MSPTEWAALLEAVAAALWPVVAIVVVLVLVPHVGRMLRNAEEFTLEVGGQKISLQSASEGLRKLVVDLQEKVASLESGGVSAVGAVEPAHASSFRILWVDDREEANVFEKAALSDAEGVRIRSALTTRDALRALSLSQFDAVVSDIHRVEGGQEVPDAGVRLGRAIRERGLTLPLIFYSSSFSRERFKADIEALGAQGTSSPTELLAMLKAARSSEPFPES